MLPNNRHCYVYHIFINLVKPPVRREWCKMLLIIPTYRLQLSAVPCYLLFDLYGTEVYFVTLCPKINLYMSSKCVDLHLCCSQNFKTHLSINPFMNLMSVIRGILRPKSYRSYFDFQTFWISAYQAHIQNRRKETILKNYKTIFPSHSHSFPFRVSNATPPQWYSINSRYIGTWRLLTNVLLMALRNIIIAVQELQLNIIKCIDLNWGHNYKWQYEMQTVLTSTTSTHFK